MDNKKILGVGDLYTRNFDCKKYNSVYDAEVITAIYEEIG